MTSKLVVNTIEADTGISSVSFASSISMNSTAKFHFSAAGIDIGADTNINRPASGVIGFNINSSEKVRINSNGQLGIGTNNPTQLIEVQNRSTGTVCGLNVGTQYGNAHFGGYNNYPAIMNSGNQPLIYCDTNNDRTVLFGDTVGFGTTCAFRVNNAERLRIASDGKITVAANSDIRFTNGTWTGEVAGKIQQNSNNLYIQGGTGGIRFRHASSGTNQFSMTNGGNFEITNGDLVVASGHGIDFSAQTPTSATGASTTAEILDHYEEGSWTPVYLNVNTPTYGHRSGTYTRIGRAVHCQFQISVDSGLDTSDGSAVNIGGLPFSGNSAHESVVFSFGKLTNILSNARLAEVTNFRFGGTYIMLHRGSNYDINYTLCNSSGHLQAAFTYQMT